MTSAAGRLFWAAVCTCALFGWANPAAAGFVAPPAPTRWVTDSAAFLTPSTRDSLDAELQAYERRTGHQVIVYIGTTTGNVPLEDYTVNAFAAWKVGRKGLDDGLVLFIFAKDHKVRIEVGYGLESVVTDAKSSEIIRNIIVPAIRAGDNDAAVTNGVAQILATIDGSPAPEAGGGSGGGGNVGDSGESPPTSAQPSLGSLIFIAIAFIVFLIIFIRSPTFALWLLFNLLSGGRGGGGGFSGGGGGFSGGGGRSGGGGASGSW